MKCLLDTHVWIWSVTEPERVGDQLRRRIEDGDDDLWLSPISVWETMLLMEAGRIATDDDPSVTIDFMRSQYPLREATLTTSVAVRSRMIELPQQDPADRFLAATALEYGLTLLTHDKALLAASGVPTLGP